MKTYIGIDLGGTNVRVAKVTEDGEVLEQVKAPSYSHDGTEKVMTNMKELIHSIPNWEEASGIGAGVPGPVNTKEGVMMLSSNLPGFTGYPLAKEIEEEFKLPTFLDNDANVAGLAEALVGAGKGLQSIFYITISTGVGGVLVVDGKTVSGKHGFGGEIANIIIDRNREKRNYLNAGAVEVEASGTALVRKGKEVFGEHIEHGGQIFELARNGNADAKAVIDDIQKDLGQMFATIACVCDPDMFVIGGGMMKSADVLLPGLVEHYKSMSHEALWDTPFVLAELEEPGIIGAAMLPKSQGI